MIDLIEIRERGPTPRGMGKVWRGASKAAFLSTAELFDEVYRDRRFTRAHAEAAGYYKRKGEGLPEGSKAWRRSYAARKQRQHRHQRPLEFSGETRDRLRSGGRRSSTSNSARITYSQARKFNFRHPKSQIRMSEEFTRLIPEEIKQLGQHYDSRLDAELADANFTSTERIGAG